MTPRPHVSLRPQPERQLGAHLVDPRDVDVGDGETVALGLALRDDLAPRVDDRRAAVQRSAVGTVVPAGGGS